MTVTGTRLASHSSSGGGKLPVLTSTPSTLLAIAASRRKSRLAVSVQNVTSTDQFRSLAT